MSNTKGQQRGAVLKEVVLKEEGVSLEVAVPEEAV
jgi:hypothetical protein